MTDMLRRIQLLNVGALYCFIEVDLSNWGHTEPLRFHTNGSVQVETVGNEELQTFTPLSDMTYKGDVYSFAHTKIDGIQLSNDGKVNTPTITVDNIINGQKGAVSVLCSMNDNLVGAKVTVMYTTDEAYDAGTHQEERQVWWIDRKSADNEAIVEFELTSPLDFKRQRVPTRLISDICFWAIRGQYRGEDCGYTGNAYFDRRGNAVDSVTLDDCGGTCEDCTKRFGSGAELPFGGFLIPYRTDY